MKHPRGPKRMFFYLAVCGLLATFAFGQARSGATGRKIADISQIQHIVIIVKQNKSFDHYFGAFPGVNGVTTGTLSTDSSSTWSR